MEVLWPLARVAALRVVRAPLGVVAAARRVGRAQGDVVDAEGEVDAPRRVQVPVVLGEELPPRRVLVVLGGSIALDSLSWYLPVLQTIPHALCLPPPSSAFSSTDNLFILVAPAL